MTADSATSRALVQASLLLTAAAFASRILGWLRLAVIGSQFGASSDLDAYFAAFRIPDAIFQLVVAGLAWPSSSWTVRRSAPPSSR